MKNMIIGKDKLKKQQKTGMMIIAVEGLDKSGKHSAVTSLYDFFLSKGLKVEQTSFPNYETPIGKLIGKWLKGDFLADEKTFELLQAADKQLGQTYIQECERQGVDILLIDRYVHTEWAYGAYDNDERWLAELTRYMRLPDAAIYLDVEPEVSMNRKGKYGDNDYYESDIERLRYTKNEYLCLFEETQDIVHTQIVDANKPQLVVKGKIIEAADQLYSMFKEGQMSNSKEISKDLVTV
ncbi:dTMP kinase [Salipaludibacillus agaradhaerens]|jgi:dTMP kinase|uniref:dTMP kinase n=1 Tax=Salipaludibacillus agaradhaerens TaxID=76935 RepID=UPI002150BB5F|nr:dTMP kinase [Salipaludibacillus agaradhaerens]MCR6108686.1 dTMP kinase [Salipaludibacillus agaradhaerens]MCR6120709.1 dTMP kinase [Salipaludibacillus agaradhaerens]